MVNEPCHLGQHFHLRKGDTQHQRADERTRVVLCRGSEQRLHFSCRSSWGALHLLKSCRGAMGMRSLRIAVSMHLIHALQTDLVGHLQEKRGRESPYGEDRGKPMRGKAPDIPGPGPVHRQAGRLTDSGCEAQVPSAT